jgi:hypothetical protein
MYTYEQTVIIHAGLPSLARSPEHVQLNVYIFNVFSMHLYTCKIIVTE